MEYLQRILKALERGEYETTLHARQRMAQRNVAHADIRSCGETGKAIKQESGKIKVSGVDVDGDDLSIICVEENGVLIITVF